MSIVWLASYPKSGNTWVRAFLTRYLASEEAFDLQNLVGADLSNRRDLFDDLMGVTSSDLTEDEIDLNRPEYHRRLFAETAGPCFAKVHNAWSRNRAGAAIFPADISRGAVLILRNPLDVAPSYAYQIGCDVTFIAERMADRETRISRHGPLYGVDLPQRLLDWGGHAESWLAQAEIPVLALHYEDLLHDPHTGFGAILRFAGLEPDPARMALAISGTSFGTLRSAEAQRGYSGRGAPADRFFRRGVSGGWRDSLPEDVVRRIVDAQRDPMIRLGYADIVAEIDRPAGEAGRDDPDRGIA